MTTYWMTLTLQSDATFGRGDGVAGLVDAEVQHDEFGLPYLGGKTLKGLLGAECAEILFALGHSQPEARMEQWYKAAARLFGTPGSGESENGRLHFGDARLPRALRHAIAAEFPPPNAPKARGLRQRANLESLTALRRQTAMHEVTGAPLENTLRTMRVILRDTSFEAELIWLDSDSLNVHEQALLAACLRAFRRAGTGRNRGRGRLKEIDLYTVHPGEPTAKSITDDWFKEFRKAVA